MNKSAFKIFGLSIGGVTLVAGGVATGVYFAGDKGNDKSTAYLMDDKIFKNKSSALDYIMSKSELTKVPVYKDKEYVTSTGEWMLSDAWNDALKDVNFVEDLYYTSELPVNHDLGFVDVSEVESLYNSDDRRVVYGVAPIENDPSSDRFGLPKLDANDEPIYYMYASEAKAKEAWLKINDIKTIAHDGEVETYFADSEADVAWDNRARIGDFTMDESIKEISLRQDVFETLFKLEEEGFDYDTQLETQALPGTTTFVEGDVNIFKDDPSRRFQITENGKPTDSRFGLPIPLYTPGWKYTSILSEFDVNQGATRVYFIADKNGNKIDNSMATSYYIPATLGDGMPIPNWYLSVDNATKQVSGDLYDQWPNLVELKPTKTSGLDYYDNGKEDPSSVKTHFDSLEDAYDVLVIEVK